MPIAVGILGLWGVEQIILCPLCESAYNFISGAIYDRDLGDRGQVIITMECELGTGCGKSWKIVFESSHGMSSVQTEYEQTYHEYIKSYEWRIKADKAKERAGYRCQICNKSKDEVILDAHHRTYERLGIEMPEDITVLCRGCHELYEKLKGVS